MRRGRWLLTCAAAAVLLYFAALAVIDAAAPPPFHAPGGIWRATDPAPSP